MQAACYFKTFTPTYFNRYFIFPNKTSSSNIAICMYKNFTEGNTVSWILMDHSKRISKIFKTFVHSLSPSFKQLIKNPHALNAYYRIYSIYYLLEYHIYYDRMYPILTSVLFHYSITLWHKHFASLHNTHDGRHFATLAF